MLEASRNTDPRQRLSALFLFAITILLLTVAQARHFHDRPYRQDEAWTVHYALGNIERVGLIPHISQMFRQVPPENFVQDIWVYFFGHHENIVRFGSKLLTIIALAMFVRLAGDLFDLQTAWLALVLLGSYAIYVFFTHEARPYAILACGAIGFQWALLRFIRKPNAMRACLALLLAVAPTYSHPFMVAVLAAQALCVLVFVKWDRVLYRRGLWLYLLIAVASLYRVYIHFADRGGVIRYNVHSTWNGVLSLYDHFRSNPDSLGLLLLAGGLALFLVNLARDLRGQCAGPPGSVAESHERPTAIERRMRFTRHWRAGWLILSALVMFGLPFIVNTFVPSMTPRNMLILAPTLILIAVTALRQMPRHLQLLTLLFFCVPFLTQFRVFVGNAGYWDMASYIEARLDPAEDRVFVAAGQSWETIPISYYLRERTGLRLSQQDIFSISWDNPAEDSFAPHGYRSENWASGFNPGDWERLQAFLGDSNRVWAIKGKPGQGAQNMLAQMEREYTVYTVVDFPGESYYLPLEVLEYRRQPASLGAPLWRFGDAFNVLHWRLNGDHTVPPCTTISVDSWWSLAQESTGLYSSTLVLVGEDGQGVSNADNVPGGAYLTSIWQPGQPYFDERELLIPCDLAEGDYPLVLGMYQLPAEPGDPVENLPVYTAAGKLTGRRHEYLTTLRVRR
ncbi:MAG: hypothetical protein F4X02_16215 [Chloroflexi bacterium]|nr:hypothetical protein [Chloroflexota bacterium]